MVALLVATLALAPSQRAQQQNQNDIKLAKIEFVGLERYKPEEAVTASGLQVGQVVDEASLDAAASRLMESGLFKNLSFSFRAAKGQGTVVFKVEELRARAPVIFDNFVWFTEEELSERLRSAVPGFDGTAPEAGGMTDAIKKALVAILREKNIAGDVEYMPSADLAGRNSEHVFAARGAQLRVCELKYPGSRAVPEATLIENSSGVFNNDYSRMYVRSYAQSNLMPLYRERGHLRAAFREPRAALVTTGECKDGVSLAVPVDEGSAYAWERAEWAGNQALAPQELDAALGMKQKELANGLKVDKGMLSVAKAYGRKGHLTARVRATPAFDEEGRKVTFRFDVEEGPQYRMGELTITGLQEQDANNLRTRWRLASREPFDAGYAKEFTDKEVPEVLKRAALEKRVTTGLIIDIDTRPDREKFTVDVTINFKEKKEGSD